VDSGVLELLHIDDDLVDQRMVERALRDAPAPVRLTQALTLDDGTRALESGDFHVVLLDLDLGLHRDLEALEELQARGFRHPIVVIIEERCPERRAALARAGAADVIVRSEIDGPNLWRLTSQAAARAARDSDDAGVTLVAELSTPPMSFEAGDEVGPYVVEAVIGQGGMSTVYRVRHHRTNALHALKIVTAGRTVASARVELEATIQAAVLHPNVVPATDVIEISDEHIGLVMQYVAGPSLYEWATHRLRTGPERMSVLRQVVKGVRSMHVRGFIHRDLKPSNVLLERTRKGDWIARVADFGIAKVIGVEPQGGPLTLPGSMLGTPGYIAPEQIEDASQVTERADIFSLGCLVYLLCCGRPAFRGSTSIGLMMKIRMGEYVPPLEVRPDLPDRLVRVIEWALVVDPALRLPDCTTLLEGLAAVDDSALPLVRVDPTTTPD